jgi:hypothetical protein
MGNTLGTYTQIKRVNDQIKSNYNINKALIEATMGKNLLVAQNNINTAINDVLMQKNIVQQNIDQQMSKFLIHRGEGITGGNSVAREAQTFLNKRARMLSTFDTKLNNVVGAIFDKTAQANESLFKKGIASYYTAKNSMYDNSSASILTANGLLNDGLTIAKIIGAI